MKYAANGRKHSPSHICKDRIYTELYLWLHFRTIVHLFCLIQVPIRGLRLGTLPIRSSSRSLRSTTVASLSFHSFRPSVSPREMLWPYERRTGWLIVPCACATDYLHTETRQREEGISENKSSNVPADTYSSVGIILLSSKCLSVSLQI
jgi:hypothetical protein